MSEEEAKRWFVALPDDDMSEAEVVEWVAAGEQVGITPEPVDLGLFELELI